MQFSWLTSQKCVGCHCYSLIGTWATNKRPTKVQPFMTKKEFLTSARLRTGQNAYVVYSCNIKAEHLKMFMTPVPTFLLVPSKIRKKYFSGQNFLFQRTCEPVLNSQTTMHWNKTRLCLRLVQGQTSKFLPPVSLWNNSTPIHATSSLGTSCLISRRYSGCQPDQSSAVRKRKRNKRKTMLEMIEPYACRHRVRMHRFKCSCMSFFSFLTGELKRSFGQYRKVETISWRSILGKKQGRHSSWVPQSLSFICASSIFVPTRLQIPVE